MFYVFKNLIVCNNNYYKYIYLMMIFERERKDEKTGERS